jgi:hypothetical protein
MMTARTILSAIARLRRNSFHKPSLRESQTEADKIEDDQGAPNLLRNAS